MYVAFDIPIFYMRGMLKCVKNSINFFTRKKYNWNQKRITGIKKKKYNWNQKIVVIKLKDLVL